MAWRGVPGSSLLVGWRENENCGNLRGKGLRRSELEWPGLLEGARTVKVSRGEGLQVSCFKDCPRQSFNLIARSPEFDVYQPCSGCGYIR